MPTAQYESGQRLHVTLDRIFSNAAAGSWESTATIEPYDGVNLPGVVQIDAPTAATHEIIAASSHVAGGHLPFFSESINNAPGHYRYYIFVPSTIAPGDRVQVHIGTTTATLALPTTHVYDIGGKKYIGAELSTIISDAQNKPGYGDPEPAHVNPGLVPDPNHPNAHHDPRALAPKQRALVVYESDTAAAGGGRMYAVDATNAAGVPIPAFRTGPTLPPTGTIIGQGFLNTTNNLSYVWDGLSWQPIVPPSIVPYPDDNSILIDSTSAPGTYAFSSSTGNFFVRYTDSSNVTHWRQIGIRTYDNENTLLADTTAADGSVAYANNTKRVWNRVNGSWRTSSIWLETEANILASQAYVGAVAVATDTAKLWVGDGIDWVGQPFREYATQAALLVATPSDGVLAVAVDTGHAFYRSGGAWIGLNDESRVNVVADSSGVGADEGGLVFDVAKNMIRVFHNGAWHNAMPHNLGVKFTDSDDFSAAFTDSGIGYNEQSRHLWFKNSDDGSWHSVDLTPPMNALNHSAPDGGQWCEISIPNTVHNRFQVDFAFQFDVDANIAIELFIDNETTSYNLNAAVHSSYIGTYNGSVVDSSDAKTALGWDAISCLNPRQVNYYPGAHKVGKATVYFQKLNSGNTIMNWDIQYTGESAHPIRVSGCAHLNMDVTRFKKINIGGQTAAYTLTHGTATITTT